MRQLTLVKESPRILPESAAEPERGPILRQGMHEDPIKGGGLHWAPERI